MIHHHSKKYCHGQSTNDWINAAADFVATCPPGLEGACLEIMSAYQNSPLVLAHKAYIALMWCNQIYIEHCAMEGLLSAENIQGYPADALIVIFKAKSIN